MRTRSGRVYARRALVQGPCCRYGAHGRAGDQFAPIGRQVQQHPKTDQEEPELRRDQYRPGSNRMVGGQIPRRQGDVGVGEQQDQPCGAGRYFWMPRSG